MELLDHQKEHAKKIWDLLVKDRVFSFVDTSKTGLGKTFTTLWLAKNLQEKYNLKVMIVAPSEASLYNDDGWVCHAEEYGIKIFAATTYSALRGGKSVVSHPWLLPDPEKKKKWRTTEAFEKLCSSGLFLIFDEFHHSKNQSISHFACAALVKTAKKYRKYCRVALLSHTPGDKKEHIPQILRMTGLITNRKLFKHIPFTRDYVVDGYGLDELRKVCTKLAKDDKYVIDGMMNNISKTRSLVICKDLYDNYIRSIITFAMPKPEQKYFTTFQNAFLETEPNSLEIVQQGINMLAGAVVWNHANQQVGNTDQWNMGAITNALKLIERGKLLSIARYVMKEVKKNPKKKFVICCGAFSIEHHEFLKSIIYRESKVEDYLELFGELKKKNKNWGKLPKDMIHYIASFVKEKVYADVFNGKLKKEERVETIRKFQKDTNQSWCLIVSPGTGSESISLQDKHGDRSREMLIVPTYNFMQTIQSSGRVDRIGMKSNAKVSIVYSKEASLETRILNSMIRKTKIAKDLLAEDQKVTFPGEYPYFIEGERDIELERKLNELKKMCNK